MRRVSAPLALLLLLAGCAGPKRLPPVDDVPPPRPAPEEDPTLVDEHDPVLADRAIRRLVERLEAEHRSGGIHGQLSASTAAAMRCNTSGMALWTRAQLAMNGVSIGLLRKVSPASMIAWAKISTISSSAC